MQELQGPPKVLCRNDGVPKSIVNTTVQGTVQELRGPLATPNVLCRKYKVPSRPLMYCAGITGSLPLLLPNGAARGWRPPPSSSPIGQHEARQTARRTGEGGAPAPASRAPVEGTRNTLLPTAFIVGVVMEIAVL